MNPNDSNGNRGDIGLKRVKWQYRLIRDPKESNWNRG